MQNFQNSDTNFKSSRLNESSTKKKLNYTLIDTIMECVRTVEDVLLKENIMALDCEGVLLSKEGRLTLIQVF